MKHCKTLLCMILSSLILSSCTSEIKETPQTETENTETSAVSETYVSSPVTEAQTEPEPDPFYPVLPLKEEDFPSMDGSTSAIPLEAGIKAGLLGISYKEARENVKHSKTHVAFQNLLSGETDLIFSVPISESQQQDADAAGVHLNMVPVCKEAFVFVVNKNNPVDSLTQQQIRDIYSGKITNWSELGGNDEIIIPYQRNRDSGSQNYMTEFMDGFDFPEPAVNTLVGEMGDLMERIAVYDNSSGAIGYSVYSYAAQMYENSDRVKLIAVDGTVPSKETLADGSYPLLSSTYIIHRDNPSEKTQRFINWILSDAGQKRVLNCGYLPVADIEFPDYLKLYSAKGTGKEKPENYEPSRRVSFIYGSFSSCIEMNLDFIKDSGLRNKISEDITAAYENLVNRRYSPFRISVYGENGYISFTLNAYPQFESESGIIIPNENMSFTYDLVSGTKIEKYSDLFFKDSDFVPLLNKTIAGCISEDYGGRKLPYSDFLGVTGNIEEFTVYSVTLQEENPYFEADSDRCISFQGGFPVNFMPNLLPSEMVTGEYHSFDDLLGFVPENFTVSEKYLHEWYQHSVKYDGEKCRDEVTYSIFHSDEEIAARNEIYAKICDSLEDYYYSSGLQEKYSAYFHTRVFFRVCDTVELDEFYETDGYYYLNVLSGMIGTKNCLYYKEYSDYDHHIAGYDPETGEPLTFADIFGPEFADIDENYTMFDYKISEKPSVDDKVIFYYNINDDGNYKNTEVSIPVVREHLNMKYFSHR